LKNLFIPGLLLVILILINTYYINHIADYYLDKKAGKRIRMFEYYTKKGILNLIIFLSVIIFLIAFIFSNFFLCLSVFSMFGCVLYSVKPFHFKSRPPLDLLLHIVFYGVIACLFGVSASGENISFLNTMLGIGLGCSFGAGMILITSFDTYHDREFGIKTISIILGEKRCIYFSFLMFCISIMIFLLLNSPLLWISLFSLPFFLLLMVKKIIIKNIVLSIYYLWSFLAFTYLLLKYSFSLYHMFIIAYFIILGSLFLPGLFYSKRA